MKLIMLDMDGTLFTDDKRITQPTIEALQFAKSCGAKVGLASGRAKSLLERTIKEYHLEDIVDYAVAINGVQIVDFKKKVMKETYLLSSDSVKDIALKLEKISANFVVYDEKTRYMRYASEREKLSSKVYGTNLVEYDFSQNDRAWPKVLVISDKEQMTKEEFDYLYSMNNDVYHGFETAPYGYEFVDVRVSKDRGIATLCEYMGITMDEVMAFGDSGNDISMLKAVGLGVAMGNATADAKAAAKDVTLSNEEDGIAYYINKYFKRG